MSLVVELFRSFLHRQGFSGVSIRRVEDLNSCPCYHCFAYDHLNDRYFSQCYTLEDMSLIIRANKIFWRYLV